VGQDRTSWGAREYADALNRATAVELFELAQEVNEKWTAARELPARVSSSGPAPTSSQGQEQAGSS
jgi:hypothetical protein